MKRVALVLLLSAAGCGAHLIGISKSDLLYKKGVPEKTVKIDDETEAWGYNNTTYFIKNGVVVDRKKHLRLGLSISTNDGRRKKAE